MEKKIPVVLYKIGKEPPDGDEYEEILVDGISVSRSYESDDLPISLVTHDVLERLHNVGAIIYKRELDSTAGEDETVNAR